VCEHGFDPETVPESENCYLNLEFVSNNLVSVLNVICYSGCWSHTLDLSNVVAGFSAK